MFEITYKDNAITSANNLIDRLEVFLTQKDNMYWISYD